MIIYGNWNHAIYVLIRNKFFTEKWIFLGFDIFYSLDLEIFPCIFFGWCAITIHELMCYINKKIEFKYKYII